jgi:hypothetical protein
MVPGWEEFARRVIKELARYDREHDTSYAYYLAYREHGARVLADIMAKVDRASQWQPILKGPKHE